MIRNRFSSDDADSRAEKEDSAGIYSSLAKLSGDLLSNMHRTREIIKKDKKILDDPSLDAKRHLTKISSESKHIEEFNSSSKYGTFFVWMVILASILVFFFVLFLIRTL